VICRGIAVAILVAGSLLAQQSQTSPKPVQQNAAGNPPIASTSRGTTSLIRPTAASAFDVPESTQLILPGCAASLTARASPNRDYSTPSSRLVGRWAGRDSESAAIMCRYFGPIDKQNGTGVFVVYRLEALDEKTGARSPVLPGTGQPPHRVTWNRIEESYRIINEDPGGESVTVGFLPTSGKSATETHQIACDGKSDSPREPVGQIDLYVDDKNLGCSESNAGWKDAFSRFLAARSPAEPVYPRTGREVRYQVDGVGRASLTYRNASGGTDQMTVKLPWTLAFTGQPNNSCIFRRRTLKTGEKSRALYILMIFRCRKRSPTPPMASPQ